MATIDKIILPKIITDKYSVTDNTFINVAKADVKDKIECEIGDVMTPTSFIPQQKIKRWDNDCNVSIRLQTTETGVETVTTLDDKIVWKKGTKIEAHFYDIPDGEGAREFEVILKSKPKTNVVQFSVVDKDVDYALQPRMDAGQVAEEKARADGYQNISWFNQEFIDLYYNPNDRKDGYTETTRPDGERPINIVHSYAIYAKTPKTNWTGGKEYKCGKIGHIFRPKIIDSAGTEVWGDLHIENGILSVTIPQDFLDKAVYPVRHAAGLTFGYTGAGASIESYIGNCGGANNFTSGRTGIGFTAAAGTITDINIYVDTNMASATNGTTLFAVNQKDSGGANSHGLTGSSEATVSYPTSKAWRSKTGLSIAVTNGTDYSLNVTANATNLTSGKSFRLYYDTASIVPFYYEGFFNTVAATAYSNSKENPWTVTPSNITDNVSIYATYTAAGAKPQINIGDVWKQSTAVQINIGDTWKAVTKMQINIGDVWKSIFSLFLMITSIWKK